MRIVFATYQGLPQFTPSDELLAAALTARGATVRAASWDTIDPRDASVRLVCLRSTWDYHLRFDEFVEWVARFRDHPGKLWNPPDTVLWNADKIYLRALEQSGVTIPRTHWTEPRRRVNISELCAAHGWQQAVLKPRVSASAFGTHLVRPDTTLSDDEWAPLEQAGALLQEFMPEVASRGELSLLFADGVFSHAARKVASPGEFRVQPHFGGSSVREEATPVMRAFGARVLAACPHATLYARVDVVDAERGPVLMELELIEPELFFSLAPDSVGAFADAILARAQPG